MLTDIVGKVSRNIGNQSVYQIYANYRTHSYADRYEVIIEENSCRILSLRLTGIDLPVKNADYQGDVKSESWKGDKPRPRPVPRRCGYDPRTNIYIPCH
jgi:hypothetical protein